MTEKNYSWAKILWAFSGIILFFSAIHVINVPDKHLTNVAPHLGLAMLFTGCVNLVIYFFKHKRIHGCHWLLADGLSTVCLSFFPTFNTVIPVAVIPFFFGIWELASGVLKFTESTELYEENIRGWQWFVGVGLIELFSGVASMVKPIDEAVGMNHVIAIIFFVQSIGYIFKIRMYPYLAASAPLFMHEKNECDEQESETAQTTAE